MSLRPRLPNASREHVLPDPSVEGGNTSTLDGGTLSSDVVQVLSIFDSGVTVTLGAVPGAANSRVYRPVTVNRASGFELRPRGSPLLPGGQDSAPAPSDVGFAARSSRGCTFLCMRFGFMGLLGLQYRLGPGSAFLEAGYRWVPVQHFSTARRFQFSQAVPVGACRP